MKRLIFACCLAACTIATTSAEGAWIEINKDKKECSVQTEKIAQNISNLLSEINRAQTEGTQLNFRTIEISSDAQKSLSNLWENHPFVCLETESENPIRMADGTFQVRNIPLELCPSDGEAGDKVYQEAVVNLDPSGQIISFYFAISNNLYREVIKEGAEVSDMHRRQMILDYVEKLYTAYYEKDIEFLAQAFGNDAILISGKVTQVKKTDWPISENKVSYSTQNKDQYIACLRRIFGMTNDIQAFISEIQIQRHPTVSEAYGVRLRQGYRANISKSIFEDDGYLFLLWDFTDEEHPTIRIRTWQPYWMDGAKTEHIAEEEIFDIGDFNIDIDRE